MQNKQISKRRRKFYLDLQMHLQLINEAQSLVDDDHMDVRLNMRKKMTLTGTMSKTWTLG
jgi:hypothetical protein